MHNTRNLQQELQWLPRAMIEMQLRNQPSQNLKQDKAASHSM